MKRLNNRGWGLQVMMVCVLILMIALVVIAVLVQQTFGDIVNPNSPTSTTQTTQTTETKQTYSDLEDKIITAAKTYQKNNYSDILDGEQISVTIKQLKNQKLLTDVNDIKDETACTGYALFTRKNDEITYKAYIKCSNYTTSGYEDYYDIN